jgi:hypothetical protein
VEEAAEDKFREIQEDFFMKGRELKMSEFICITREDEDFQKALIKIGILQFDKEEEMIEDLRDELDKGKDVLRDDEAQEYFENRKLGIEKKTDD